VGHACSAEPGVYLPGRSGCRIQDIVIVASDSVLRCDTADRVLGVVAA
jgi:Xaa-Pro aminopeptidase